MNYEQLRCYNFHGLEIEFTFSADEAEVSAASPAYSCMHLGADSKHKSEAITFGLRDDLQRI